MNGRPVLITGGAGFIGSNLADRLAADGRAVMIYDSLARPGVEANLAWLKARHGEAVTAVVADLRDRDTLERAVAEAESVFHLAAQVAVTTSLEAPIEDFQVNLEATVRLLEAVRAKPEPCPLLFASTNKVYGDLADLELEAGPRGWRPREGAAAQSGIAEDRPLDFHTPYGCSKGAADQYVLDYARSYGLPAAVLRMSCVYGRRQMGTEDQGWVAHFAISILEGRPITVYGDGRQVRDVLDVRDAVQAYVRGRERIGAVAGRALNLGGGPRNAASLLEVVSALEDLTGRKARVEHGPWRRGDQRWYVSDPRAAREALDLDPFLDWREGVADLVGWLREGRAAPREALAGASA